MSSPRATLLVIVLLLVTFSNTCTASSGSANQPKIVKQRNSNNRAGGCLNYGHSCLGAHGKRSGPGNSAPPLAQKALLEVLMAALLEASTTAQDHDNTRGNADHTMVQHTENPNSLNSQHKLGQHRSESPLKRPSHNNVILSARPDTWFPINTDLLEGLAVNMKPEDVAVQGDDMLYAYDAEDLQDNVDDYQRGTSAKTMSTWSPRRMQALLEKQGVDLSKLGNWIRR